MGTFDQDLFRKTFEKYQEAIKTLSAKP